MNKQTNNKRNLAQETIHEPPNKILKIEEKEINCCKHFQNFTKVVCDNLATCFCEECSKSMCDKCFEFNHKIRKHLKKSLTEIKIKSNCLKHPNKNNEFYCMIEKIQCCSLCAVYEHKNHDLVLLDDFISLSKQKIERFDSEIFSNKFMNEFEEINQNIQKERQEYKERIEMEKQEYMERIQKLSSEHKTKLKQLNERKSLRNDNFQVYQLIRSCYKQENDIDQLGIWVKYLEEIFSENKNEMSFFGCGYNSLGMLGTGDFEEKQTFIEIPFFQNKNIKFMSCGAYFNCVYSGN
jgi:hypothetical protein